YRELDSKISDLKKDSASKEAVVLDKFDALTLAQQKDEKSAATHAAERAWQQAVRDVNTDADLMIRLQHEQSALPPTLRRWEEKPCGAWWVNWMCLFLERSSLGSQSSTPETLEIVFSAQSALTRMSQIVLPLLLGLLGAYSFVLRSMGKDIREHSFEPHS